MARVARFALVGLLNTATDFGTFLLLVSLAVPVAVANMLAYGCGMVVSFTLNRNWTFADGGRSSVSADRLLRFVAVNVAAMVVSTLVVVGLSAFLPIVLAKALAICLSAVISYLGMSRIVFAQQS